MTTVSNRSRQCLSAAVIMIAVLGLGPGWVPSALAHGDAATSATRNEHDSHHGHAQSPVRHVRSQVIYHLPEVDLVASDGSVISLHEALDADGMPLLLNFVFTSCPGTCPVMSATFSQFQKRLGGEAASKVRMVSISIDPEFDTPARLREYASKFNAGPQWDFYTGRLDDITAVQKAFDTYRGNKMSHDPLTLARAAGDMTWTRLDGFVKVSDLLAEYQRLARE